MIIIEVLPGILKIENTNFVEFAKVMTSAALIVFITYTFSGWLGLIAENEIDEWSTLSYIKITRGDDAAIENRKNQNRWATVKSGLAIFSSILISIVTKVTATFIMSYFAK